jgi:hypothetical protein
MLSVMDGTNGVSESLDENFNLSVLIGNHLISPTDARGEVLSPSTVGHHVEKL